MQYDLRIIFETQLSHKTGFQLQILDFGLRIEGMNVDFRFWDAEGRDAIKRKAQGPEPKNDFVLCCLEP